ncbi:MAG TPA: hypothetical protein VJT71_13645 [Pyrinomonadaceae bacterium]|nr:hypothetical protein [Pyrinomonadaceae bacterium]
MKRILFGTLCGVISVVTICPAIAESGDSAGEERIEITVPTAPWKLTLPKNDFGVRRQQIDPKGRFGSTFLTDDDRHLNISIFVRPASECQDSKSCRDMLWAKYRSRPNLESVALAEIGAASCVEFVDPMFQGHPVRQQNMLAVFVVDGFRVDLHLMGADKDRNRELFTRIIKAIKFEPKGAPKS